MRIDPGAHASTGNNPYHRHMDWARRHGQLFAEWHLLELAPQAGAVNRGMFVTACGESLGDEEFMLERVDAESALGSRCSACQGIALARKRP